MKRSKRGERGKKKDELLVKPKRPMTAYNFFFRDERARILSESNDGNNRTSFEDVGRIVGQRWRNIEANELAKYNRLAKEDNERYRNEMETFYKDELRLMCLGHTATGAASREEEDHGAEPRKPSAGVVSGSGSGSGGQPPKTAGSGSAVPPVVTSAAVTSGGRDQFAAPAASASEGRHMMGMAQQHQQQQQMLFNRAAVSGLSQMNAAGQGQMQLANHAAAGGMLNPFQIQNTSNLQNNVPGAGAGGGVSALNPMNVGSAIPNMSSPQNDASAAGLADDDQVLRLLLQHQQQQSASTLLGRTRVPNETVVSLILTQKASLQKQQQKLMEEMKVLQLKNSLLDKMLADELATVQGGGGQNNLQAAQVQAQVQAQAQAQAQANNSGAQGEFGTLTAEQLLQAMQSQKPAAATAVPGQNNLQAQPQANSAGSQGGYGTLSAEQLLQALQQRQHPMTSGAANPSLVSHAAAMGQSLGRSAMFDNAPAPPPVSAPAAVSAPAPLAATSAPMAHMMQENALYGSIAQQPTSLSHLMHNSAQPGMADPGNNSSAAANNQQGDNSMSMEEMIMKHFMDQNK